MSTQKPCCTKPPGPSFSGLPEVGAAQYSGPFRGVNDSLEPSGFPERHAGKTALAGLQKVARTDLQDGVLGGHFLAIHLDRALLDQAICRGRARCQAGVLQDAHALGVELVRDQDDGYVNNFIIEAGTSGVDITNLRDYCSSPYYTVGIKRMSKDWFGDDLQRYIDTQPVYRIAPDGKMTIVTEDSVYPNGLCFSPDETRLYVVDTPSGVKTTHVYDIVDGQAVNGRLFFDAMPGYADGIRCDTEGNVWCGFSGGPGQDGVAVFADFFNIAAAADDHAAAPRVKARQRAASPDDDAASGKIRPRYHLHQGIERAKGLVVRDVFLRLGGHDEREFEVVSGVHAGGLSGLFSIARPYLNTPRTPRG